MSQISEDNYSPLNKALQDVFNSYKRAGYAALFVFRDSWGDTLYAAVKPQVPAWDAFDDAAAPHGAKQPLIAFDLRGEYAAQMPEHFLETLETLDAFAYAPMIHIAAPNGIVPEVEKRRAVAKMMQPELTVIPGTRTPQTSEKRSPPSGKLRLI